MNHTPLPPEARDAMIAAAKRNSVATIRWMELLSAAVRWLKHKLHRCSEDGCWSKGRDCYLPDNSTGKPDEYVCCEHARGAGYCWCCGNFFAGIESFDFGETGLCENCDDQLKCETGEYDDPDETYDCEF